MALSKKDLEQLEQDQETKDKLKNSSIVKLLSDTPSNTVNKTKVRASNKNIKFNLSIDANKLEQLKIIKFINKTDISEIINNLVSDYLDKEENKNIIDNYKSMKGNK